MGSLPAERKVLLFTVGPSRFALRLSQVREIIALPGDAVEATSRGVAVPALSVAVALGLPAVPTRFALVTEAVPPIALELVVPALGWAPMEPAGELPGPPPEVDFPTARELLFTRGRRTYAVPIQLLAQVLEDPAVFPVPLTPSAHRGLLYHGRAIHPVFDVSVLYGEPAADGASTALLIEAGGHAIAVLADLILPAGGASEQVVSRPSWDLVFTGS